MSTKLHAGHEIVGLSLEALLPELLKLQLTMKERAAELVRQFIVNLAVSRFDHHHFGIEKAPSAHLLGDARMELADRQEELRRTRRRDPAVDFEFSLTLFPVKGRLLALVFTEQKALRDHWEAQTWRREFGYWDNSDPPGDLADDEWQMREGFWDEAFRQSSIPAEAGYSITLVPEGALWAEVEDEHVLALVPSAQSRVQQLVLPKLLALRTEQGLPPLTRFSELNRLRQSEQAAACERLLLAEMPRLTPGALRDGATAGLYFD